jgi:DNA (cytosine-5)-methyltransferase 1
MLGEGLAAGLRHLGIDSRCILYAEREAYPCAVLEARMEEGSLAPAPIWCGDFTELDAKRFRGKVDCVVAGFPCQDLSVAGRRAGLDGKRSGLFFEVTRIAADCGAQFMLLENVAGIATATATVMDEAEGELEERAASRVVGELADLGWNAEWLTLSASDVGASHGRARWFCIAWRTVGNAQHHGHDAEPQLRSHEAASDQRRAEKPQQAEQPAGASRSADAPGVSGCTGQPMGDTGLQHEQSRQRFYGAKHPSASDALGDPHQQRAHGSGSLGQQAGCGECTHDGCFMANSERVCGKRRGDTGDMARQGGSAESQARERQRSRFAADGGECAMADPGSPRQQGCEQHGTLHDHRGGAEAHGSTAEFCDDELFAPGPTDPRWSAIIAAHPHLAPALEPAFRVVVNGLAFDMDDSRAARLKCVGNGVVAAQAGCAVVILFRRSGLCVAMKC